MLWPMMCTLRAPVSASTCSTLARSARERTLTLSAQGTDEW